MQAVVNWSIVPAQSIVAKNLRQLGMTQPLFQSHGFGNIRYVEAAGQAAEGILFPAGRLLVADVLPDGHPQKALLVDYKRSTRRSSARRSAPSAGTPTTRWPCWRGRAAGGQHRPGEGARRHRGPEGLRRHRGHLQLLPADHNGLAPDAFEMLTVKGGKFVLYLR